jgi:hypothetical protein
VTDPFTPRSYPTPAANRCPGAHTVERERASICVLALLNHISLIIPLNGCVVVQQAHRSWIPGCYWS